MNITEQKAKRINCELYESFIIYKMNYQNHLSVVGTVQYSSIILHSKIIHSIILHLLQTLGLLEDLENLYYELEEQLPPAEKRKVYLPNKGSILQEFEQKHNILVDMHCKMEDEMAKLNQELSRWKLA